MSAMMIGALALLLLIILIFLHVPVAVAMAVVGLAATCLLTGNIQGGLSLFADSAVESLSYSGFMIIPLFILMGGFAGISGLSRDLFRLSAAWLGWAKGGVGLATIGTCAGFGAICGSSVATTATMVNMALPELQKRHYNDVLSSGVIVGGSTLGSIIPPSMIMVIYAIQAEQSVRDLFVAALLPGLIAVLFCLIAVRAYVSMNPESAPETEHSDLGEKIRATAAAWGVILIGAKIFSHAMTESGLAQGFVQWVLGLGLPPLAIVFVLVLGYIALGAVFDALAAMILTLPFVLPIILQLGYDPVWWGILNVMIIEVGMISPPVGINIFVFHGMRPEIPLGAVYRGTVPFVIAGLARIALLIFFPAIATVLL